MEAEMDIAAIEQRLVSGEELKIRYRYPIERSGRSHGAKFGVRSDKLLDVSVELERFYTKFRGESPIWLDVDEVIEVVPDDGTYKEY